jgi:hypothetical protein
MKAHAFVLLLAVFSTSAIAEPLPAGHPPVDMKEHGKGVSEVQLTQKAKVISTVDVPSYTYLEVAQDKKTLWIAAATVTAKKGDVIRFDDGMPMTNFHSKSLNRTFPSIIFVNRVVITKEKG